MQSYHIDMFSKWDVNEFLVSYFDKPATASISNGTDQNLVLLVAAVRQPLDSWKHSRSAIDRWFGERISLSAIHFKTRARANQQFPYNRWQVTSNVFHKKEKAFAISIQGSDVALFSLIASSVLCFYLFEEAFIKVVKLSVGILEADSVHLFLAVEVYRWAVAFFRFFDLFYWSVTDNYFYSKKHTWRSWSFQWAF